MCASARTTAHDSASATSRSHQRSAGQSSVHRDPEGSSTPVMVRVEEVNGRCEHSRAQGARIVAEPSDFQFGERQYTAEDPAGHQWTFSETLADVAPEDWGGRQ